MRWLLVGLLLGLPAWPARAEAKFVGMEPPVPHHCRTGKTFPEVQSCLAKLGKVSVLRDTPTAKLVSMVGTGVYLYIKRGATWQIGGMYESTPITLIDFRAVTINRHVGYRLDLGLQLIDAVALDDAGGSRPAIIRTTHAVFCSGDGYNCVDALTRCDVLVHGKSYFVFRGTLAIEDDNLVLVTGDRTRSGPTCGGEDKMYLGWAPQPR